MGNQQSNPSQDEESKPSKEEKKKQPSKDDEEQRVNPYNKENKPGFTFGMELELAMVPRDDVLDKNNEYVRSDDLKAIRDAYIPIKTEWNNKATQLGKKLPILDVADFPILDATNMNKIRKLWSRYITDLLRFGLGGMSIIWAGTKNEPSKEAQEAKAASKYYDNWTVIDDPAIDGNYGQDQWTVEIVSRITDGRDLKWKKEYEDLWGFVESCFQIQNTNVGSSHVHLKLVSDSKDLAAANFLYAKAVAKFVVFWEPCVFFLVPKRRKIRPHCLSNVRHSTELVDALVNAKKLGGTYGSIFQIIDGFQDIKSLAEFMSTGGKDYAWNFQNLYYHGDTTKQPDPTAVKESPSGTIEFRRPPGCNNIEEVYKWATISLSFVYGAVMLENKPGIYQYMKDQKVVCPPFDVARRREAREIGLPTLLQQFGRDNFDEFIKWMVESATDLGLAEHMPRKIFED